MRLTGPSPSNILHSIRLRLTLWTVGILGIILLVFSVFIYFRQARDLQLEAQKNLVLRAQQIQLILRSAPMMDPEGGTFQPPTLVGNGVISLDHNQGLALVDPDGHILQNAGDLNATTITALAAYWQQATQGTSAVTLSDQQLASNHHQWFAHDVYLVSPLANGRRWVGLILLSEPVDPQGLLPRLLATLLLGSLATLAFALVGGFWIASRAMSPVRVITRAARTIGDTDLHRRLNMKTRDELGELANTFDGMLARLEAAFDRQRQFTADASHELRTPLTIVGLEADHALERLRTPEEYERALKIIQSENEFMAHLVNDLLTLARMDAGQTRLRTEPVDLSDLALDVVDRLSPLALHSHTQLVSGELPPAQILGDRQYLTQMLFNLVENAIKYAGGKDGVVRVETGSDPGSGFGWVRIEDNGPGIPQEDLPHVFDRFYRVDKARQRSLEDQQGNEDGTVRDGSGLGLSIVQSIVRAHHGDISIQSQPGSGTQVEVRLPLENGQNATTNQPISTKTSQVKPAG